MEPIEVDADGGDPMELLVVQLHATRETFTRYRLQETLMLMGCRPRDAVAVTKEVFAVFHKHLARHEAEVIDAATPKSADGDEEPSVVYGPAPRSDQVFALPWHYLHQCIYSTLTRLDYTKPHHLLDFQVAKEITQRNQSFVVLLGGTSGTGKSTLASLLAARLRLTTVLPTDSVRHILRAFTSKEENPCAFVSTYQAGDALSEAAIKELASSDSSSQMSANRLHKRKVLKGYKLQSELVLEKLDRVLTVFERRQQSLVVEGVHLNTDQMAELVKRHPNCVPFVIYISNELKHRERFAVRARHMTIDPQENKYIKYFDNIRIIQRHLCKNADKFLIPKIDNTNVDRSIATILSTLIRVLRKVDRGERIFDDKINKMVLLSREHENSIKKAWSSKTVRKAMRPLIKQKVAKRLLLRRLLAEQSMAIFGAASHPHDGEDSSSSDEDRHHDDDLFPNGDDADVEDEEDEQTTVVGSLFSGTNARDHAATAGRNSLTGSVARGKAFLDEIEQNHAVDGNSAKLMRSLSAAIQQASLWRASQPLSKYSDWEAFVVPSRGSDATFSEVIETFQATPGYSEMKHKWKQEERRKSWMPGDSTDTAAAAAGASSGLPPKPSLRALLPSKSSRELETPQRHISFAPTSSMTPPPSSGAAGGSHPFRRTRRVQSLPPDVLDTSSVDFDLDSVSVAGHDDDDRLSQASSRRDECISPLAQSAEDTDSHFEISSQSSDDGE